MAYLARIETSDAEAFAFPIMAPPSAPASDFTSLEWSIIRYARADRMWTIRPAGPVRRLWNWWLGRGSSRLASDRLEALRTMAVLSWHFGFTVPGDDVSDFLSAGFTPDQYELLVSSVSEAKRRPARPSPTEAFA